MASIGVWVGEVDAEKIQKKLGPGETIGLFIKALVQKNLSEHFVALDCSEEEIAAIDSARNERSRNEYLRELIKKEQTEISRTEGDEGATKIDFRTLLGEEIFTKVHAEAGDNLQEYLQKILLRQTNENAIIVDCPEDELQKIDALRNDKSRQEYLRELITKDKNEQPPPAVNSGFGEQIKTQILEIQGQTKTLHGTIEKDHKTILTLLKERLPYPDSWYIDGTLIERHMMKKATIIFMGIEFFIMLAATFIFNPLSANFWDVVRICIQKWQLWELLKLMSMVFKAMVMPCLVGALLWLAFPKALRAETFKRFLKR